MVFSLAQSKVELSFHGITSLEDHIARVKKYLEQKGKRLLTSRSFASQQEKEAYHQQMADHRAQAHFFREF